MKLEEEERLEMSYPLAFLMWVILFLIVSLGWGIAISALTLLQSKRMHDHMLHRLLSARVTFFDAHPVGRILNRFSKDLGVADLVLAPVTDYFFQSYSRVFTILLFACYYVPWLLLAIGFFVLLLLLIRLRAMRVTNDTMKLELVSRSPLSTLLGASVSGLPAIRAFQQQSFFLH